MKRFNSTSALLCFLAVLPSAPAAAQVNVVTYHNDHGRTGQNLNETLLTPANVNTNTFGKLFSYSVDGYVYAQPLYVSGLTLPDQRTHNVVFIATEHNSVYAFDADSNIGPAGGLLWHTNLGPSALTPNNDFGNRYGPYHDINPEVGITGTPVIDVASGTIYLDAFTHEGSAYFHRLHALNITTGNEQPNSPVRVIAEAPGVGVGSAGGRQVFTPLQQLQRSALTLAGGILYVAYCGYADTNPYHGWVLGFDPATLQQLTNYVFNTTPNSTTAAFGANAGEAGIWMSGGGLAVDSNTNLYFEVGNGTFTATNSSGGTDYGDSFLKLATSNRLAVADYFTPYNQAALQAGDTDVGSGGLLLLPDQPGPVPHLLLGAGKEGKIYLINRDQMTTSNDHYDAVLPVDHVVQIVAGKISGSFGTPAYFNGRIYYAATGDKLKAFSVTNGLLSTGAVSVGPRTFGTPGATPSVSANGTNNGIVWALAMGSPGILAAYNATNLTTEIYNTSQAAGNRDQLANGVKFTVPTIANGKVYAGGQSAVTILGLFAGTLSFSSPSYTTPEASGTATITVNRIGGTQGVAQVSYATVPGGTAIDGIDFSNVSGTLSWGAGDSSSKSFSVPILDNNQAESNRTLNLVLSSPTGGASLGGQLKAVLTIVEDPYDAWRSVHFGTNANNPAIAGDLADPDGDGAVNLLEYALASDPNLPGRVGLPTGAIAGGQVQLHFRRNASATELTYTVQTAATLDGGWTDLMTYTAASGWVANTIGATVSESAPSSAPPDQYVNVTITDPTNLGAFGARSHFLRLGVSR